jgi:hypothetical protein
VQGDDVRESIRAELEQTRLRFHALTGSLTADQWRTSSRNPAWSNGQLLFHMMFAFMLVPSLFRILRFFSRRPDRSSAAFARTLDLGTPLFHFVNALGPRIGARLYGPRRIDAKYDRVHAAVLRRLDAVRSDEWDRSMHYPPHWDPAFTDSMSFEALFRYPVAHFNRHRSYIVTGDALPGDRPA